MLSENHLLETGKENAKLVNKQTKLCMVKADVACVITLKDENNKTSDTFTKGKKQLRKGETGVGPR